MPQMDNQGASNDLKQGQDKAKNNARTAVNQGRNAYNVAKNKAAEKGAKEGSKAAAKEAAKEGAKKAAEEGAKKGLSSVIAGAFGPETAIVVAVVAIILIIPIVILSIFPIGDIFQTQGELEAVENKLYSAVQSSYYGEIKNNETRNHIKKYVNEHYSCGARNGDISFTGSGYFVDTDTCSISASFSPGLSEMKENISAYINAVNGTIAYFGKETDDEIKAYSEGTHGPVDIYEGEIFDVSSDGTYTLTKGAKEFYDSHSDEITNTANENYIETIGLYSKNFFVYDENEERWDLRGFHIAPKTHQELQIVGYDVKTGAPIFDWVNVTVDAWYGDIGILIFYDLSGYKEDELLECVEILDSKNSNIEAYSDATSAVSSVLNEYYANYIGQFKGTYDEKGNFILGQDNRDLLFQKLLDDGTLMYVPISGLTSNFLEGMPGYSGSLLFTDFDDKSSSEIWKEINALRRTGVIGYGTAAWNCTAFAQAWFYKIYGVNALYGNGRDMVNNLLNPNNALVGDWGATHFYRGSSPAPGGIFSIGGVGNHVGCIDSVDFKNKTITFSDGNTNGAANASSTISIKRTLSFDSFQTYVKACCAAHGSGSCWVTFANPNKVDLILD